MPFQLTFDPEHRLATITGSGPADAAAIRGILLQVVADPEFKFGYRVLLDARSLDYTPTPEETRAFVEFHMSIEALRNSKVAVVVGKLVDFGMANMFAALCDLEDAPVQSFQSIIAAKEWLA
ncbi:hypothetical protein [Zavarzinella formosa]|uniref:hypothetical protein n=1 Tax=Zavarzinella formosa TaxID=360055 RepID=UPI00031F0C0F|nr:hypothetical protein [Zavarzinella formosa]